MGDYFPLSCTPGNKKTNSSSRHRGTNKTKSMDEKRIASHMNQPEKYGLYKNYRDETDISNSDICGIINLGNNCYLNSGLQIIASCTELVDELRKTNNSRGIIPHIKRAVYSLLNDKIYNPNTFMDYFCSKNSDFIKGSQCCSQNFIRTLIRNINQDSLNQGEKIYKNTQYYPSGKESTQYSKFINGIYPESKMQSIFSGITKSYSKGRCRCNHDIENYSFSYFIDLNLYLDEIDYRCRFSDVLNSNIGTPNNLSMDCPRCGREVNLKEETKIIKLPDILIFTLERYQGETNNVEIVPDSNLDMRKYIDKNLMVDGTNYELFAINVRYGRTANFGHEICQVKRDGQWYEINDRYGKKIYNPSHNDCSYGIFYRKKNSYQTYPKMTIRNEINSMEGEDDRDNKINTREDNIDEYNTDKIIDLTKDNKNNIKKPEEKKDHIELNNMGGSITTNTKNDKTIQFPKILNYNYKFTYSGLFIISLFDEFLEELKKYSIDGNCTINYIKGAEEKILKSKECDPYEIIEKFKGKSANTQNFILNIINKINDEFIHLRKNISIVQPLYSTNIANENEYKEFQKFVKKFNSESKAKYIFAIIYKSHSTGKCTNNICKKKVDNFSFNYYINQKLDFGKKNKMIYDFLELLDENFKTDSKLETNCPFCKKQTKIEIKNTIIKLPDILIFTILRDKGNEKIEIKPDTTIDMKNYIDPSLKEHNTTYELFAVNIRNKDADDCQIKKNEKWYEISEGYGKEISSPTLTNLSYGLYYRRVKNIIHSY